MRRLVIPGAWMRVAEFRRRLAESDAPQLTDAEIDAEIAAYREARRLAATTLPQPISVPGLAEAVREAHDEDW